MVALGSGAKREIEDIALTRYAFWLQTPTDKFYPDFVAKLKDGRFLVMEYKGAHLMNEDTSEKEQLGQLWEERSKGLCVFRPGSIKGNSWGNVTGQEHRHLPMKEVT